MKTIGLVVLLVSVLVLPVFAGWTVTNLNPASASNSSVTGISGGAQVGSAKIADFSHASLWNGTAGSWIDLHPIGATNSYASDVSGNQQTGYASISGSNHAGLWRGTAESWIDLNPVDAQWSYANGNFGNQQVGMAKINGLVHAGLWSGTATSWADLNPVGYANSVANGISGNQEVGSANWIGPNNNNSDHAGLWSGTAGSWVDLNPTNAKVSYAYDTSGDQQVGTAFFGDSDHDPLWGYNAILWSGTKNSWVNLRPNVGCDYSEAIGVSNGIQVGRARVRTPIPGSDAPDVNNHASLWRGTAVSWEDLHLLLPTGAYSSSTANDIYVSGSTIWIVGTATNAYGWDSILWQYTPVPEPSSLIVLGVLLVPLLFRRRR